MMGGYTKGPWESDNERPEVWAGDGFAIAEVYDWCLRRDFDGRSHPATTPDAGIDRTREEVLANARLIAAAPDLYEACQAWVRGFGNEADESAALRLTEAALSKAGEQS